MNYYKYEYQAHRELLLELIEAEQKKIQSEVELKTKENSINKYKHYLALFQKELQFLRPGNAEDMQYRKRQFDSFGKLTRKVVPPDSQLRFHGCPIYSARDILISGEISSSFDRLGFGINEDVPGKISVATKNNIETTFSPYAKLLILSIFVSMKKLKQQFVA